MDVSLGTICYIDNGEQLLLLYRNKKENDVHEGKWIGVGGKVEQGETPDECTRREVLEETGLIVDKMDFAGIVTFPEFTPNADWYTYVFRITEFHGELIKDCDEGMLEWVDYKDVLSKPTWEGDLVFLRWVLEHRPFFSAKFCYDAEGRLLEQSVEFYEK